MPAKQLLEGQTWFLNRNGRRRVCLGGGILRFRVCVREGVFVLGFLGFSLRPFMICMTFSPSCDLLFCVRISFNS